MGLAFDVGGGGLVLRVQQVKLLVEPVLGRDPRIDRAADWSDGWSLHGRVAPAGVRSIAMMRACLVLAPVAGLDETGVARARDLDLLVFRAAERVAAFCLGLGLVMGSSEVCATPSAAPPQPRPGKAPGRARSQSAPEPPQVTTATLRSNPKASQF